MGTPVHSAPPSHDVPLGDGRRDPSGWLLGAAAVATGLSAGVYYAYACSVMPALARSGDRTFVEVMQNVNDVIQNPVFFATFAGAPVFTGLAAIQQRRRGYRQAARWSAAAFVLCAAGIVTTIAVNVPLNDQLAAAGDPSSITDLSHVRSRFETPWVAWNIVRAVLTTGALGCLARALGTARPSSDES